MKKYTRLSKSKISALALTMVMVGGGAYGITSAAQIASAAPNTTSGNTQVERAVDDKNEIDDKNEPTLNGSIKVKDNYKDDTKEEIAASEAAEAQQYAGLVKITEAQAIKAAEAKVGGSATKAELGNENGSLIYEVHIGNQEVKVDAGNGNVLAVENDDNEGPEADEGYEDTETDGIDHQFEGEEEHTD